MWPEFEAQFLGKSVGEEITFTLTFPDTHIDKEVIGKTADFKARIKQLWQTQLPPLDETFAAKHDIKEGGLDALCAQVQQTIENEARNILLRHLHNTIVDKMLALNTFEVPQAMVENEITSKQQQMQKELQMYFSVKKLPEIPRDRFAEEAHKSVITGMIFSELAQTNNIKITPEQIKEEIEKRAANFAKPQEMINWFYSDENRLNHVKAELLEKAIFDFIKQQISITNKQISYEEALKLEK